MSQINLFARLAKVDVEKRQVTGVIASETPDRTGEVFDYETSKPHFEKWSNDLSKATGGESLGNVRAMHGNVAAGVVKSIEFDDVNKTISVTAEVVDDAEWKKVLKKVYTGFSIGGKYIKKWTDAANSALKRYTANPHEVSLVDLPCNPGATFAMIKAAGMETEEPVELTTEELIKLLADPETGAEEMKDLAARLAKAAGHVVNPPEPEAPVDEELAKSSWSLQELARCAETAEMIALGYGVTFDGVVKPFHADVKKAAELLLNGLLAMVSDDVAAAKERLKGVKKDAADADDLQKSSTQNVQDVLSKLYAGLGIEEGTEHEAALEKFNKLLADTEELKKSLTTEQTEHAVTKAELEKVKGEPAPAKGVKTLVVGKEEDGLSKAADSSSANEEPKDTLSLMKKAQGTPMRIGGLGSVGR